MTSRRSRTTTSRSSGVVIEVETPRDGRLYLARVEPGRVVLSTGEELVTRFDKLHALAEQVVQERVAVLVRTWWTPKGEELVDLRRATQNTALRAVESVGKNNDDTPF